MSLHEQPDDRLRYLKMKAQQFLLGILDGSIKDSPRRRDLALRILTLREDTPPQEVLDFEADQRAS